MTGGISWFQNNPFPVPAPAPAPAPVPPLITDQIMPPPLSGPTESSPVPCSSTIYAVFEGSHPGWRGAPPSDWQFPDTANTSSTEDLWFHLGYERVAYAEWIVVWQPSNEQHCARFVSMPMRVEDGYGTWTEIDQVQGAQDANGWGPRSHRFDCTAIMQAAVDAKKPLYVGFQVKGDGNVPMTVWKSRLQIAWER